MTRWTGNREQVTAELQEMGLSATSARGAVQLADIGGQVDLGYGQKLQRNVAPLTGEGDFEIIGEYRAESERERKLRLQKLINDPQRDGDGGMREVSRQGRL